MNIITNIRTFLTNGDSRTQNAKRNIFGSFLNKGFAILISLQLIPITINYVNPTQYGIWLTLSSIIGWIAYFDMGFGHGFRNKYAIAKAQNDVELAKKYLSTTYAVLSIIFASLLIVLIVVNSFLDWSRILNINSSYNNELSRVFIIIISFFCIQIVLKTFTTLLLADQRNAFSDVINTTGQFFALCIIYILTKTTSGSLIYLAFAISGVPCTILLIVSLYIFHTKYRHIKPSYKYVDFSLTKGIIGLGSKFFIIQISMLFVFQFTNIIISRIEGPEAVTIYNISYKYFNLIQMIMVIIYTPFWTAFTEAYTKKEFDWMRNAYRTLSKIWFLSIILFIGLLIASPYVFKIWLPSNISIPFKLSLVMGIYMLIMTRANLYMYLINGTGKVFIQLIIYLLFSFFNIPLAILLCDFFGLTGIVIAISIVYFIQTILGHIQIKKIIHNKSDGFWDR